jgi:hypothetical protein
MSPLSEREKREQAQKVLNKHFPHTDSAGRQRAEQLATKHFDGNYSPRPHEQVTQDASGTGNTYRQHVIAMGRRVTRKEPKGVKAKELNRIIRKDTNM